MENWNFIGILCMVNTLFGIIHTISF